MRCPTVRLCVIQKRGEITSSGLEFKKPGLLGATVPGTYIKRAAGGEVGSRRVRVTHMARRQKQKQTLRQNGKPAENKFYKVFPGQSVNIFT